MSEWQPIETAPLLPNEQTGPMLIYNPPHNHPDAVGVGVGTHNRNGWWFHHPEHEEPLSCAPSHWMPLPQPPEARS